MQKWSPKSLLASTLTCVLVLLLAGCGVSAPSRSGCYITGDLTSTTSEGAAFQAVIVQDTIRVFPGQTVPISVRLNPLVDSHDEVTVSLINLPEGFTAAPVTARIGTTARLYLHASKFAATTCFTAVQGVVQAELILTVKATGASGTSTDQSELNVQLDNPRYKPTTINLPVINITTTDAAPVDSEDDYVTATLAISDSTTSSNNLSTVTMGIKGHGNSTWAMPKKPYRIKLDDKAKLLGMKKSKNWILLANYTDKSMLRTDVAFHLANVFDMAWTPSTAFAEVYLNGEYEGVYQLSEKVEVDDNRLDIGEMDDTDISGDDLTGGYLGEIDEYQGATYTFRSPTGLPISLDDPDPPTTEQASYFKSQVTTAETSLFSVGFSNPTSGWRTHFDEASLVNWFLTQELMGNEDSDFWSSDYFYKSRGDVKIYMGPVWDFDISSGNVNYAAIKDPTVAWTSTQASWYVQLFKDPEFLDAVKTQWTAKRAQVGDVTNYIDTRSASLTQGAHNNYLRWTTLGVKVFPNTEAAGTYQGEIDFLKIWLSQRIAYMDAHYTK